jgi:hypothetical protein
MRESPPVTMPGTDVTWTVVTIDEQPYLKVTLPSGRMVYYRARVTPSGFVWVSPTPLTMKLVPEAAAP